jgi:hypothetical protein
VLLNKQGNQRLNTNKKSIEERWCWYTMQQWKFKIDVQVHVQVYLHYFTEITLKEIYKYTVNFT